MVFIEDYSIGRLMRSQRRLRRELLVRLHSGEDVIDWDSSFCGFRA